MMGWIFSTTETPNYFLVITFGFLFLAGWAFSDSTKKLRKATEKWEEVLLMYKKILAKE